MSRPSKFAIMRANRVRPKTPEARAARLRAELDATEDEIAQEWNAERRQLAYQLDDPSQLLLGGLRQVDVDIDAIHAKKNTARRWWWSLSRVAAALRPHNNFEG